DRGERVRHRDPAGIVQDQMAFRGQFRKGHSDHPLTDAESPAELRSRRGATGLGEGGVHGQPQIFAIHADIFANGSAWPAPDTSRICCGVRIGRTISAEGPVHLVWSGHRGLVLQATQEAEATPTWQSGDDQDRAIGNHDAAAVRKEAAPHYQRMAAWELPSAPPKPGGRRALPSVVTNATSSAPRARYGSGAQPGTSGLDGKAWLGKRATWRVIHAERKALASDLRSLQEDQWSTVSLCDKWTVRDVLAHMTATAKMSPPSFFVQLAGSGFSLAKLQGKNIAAQKGGS